MRQVLTVIGGANRQPAEKRAEGDGSVLDVVSVFKTIQGEGPYAGYPAVFVRLAGCNLRCPLCDTDYTAGRKLAPVADVVQTIGLLAKDVVKLVVVTGGEPFRQRLGPLVNDLRLNLFDVQIETNGTLYDCSMEEHWDEVTVVCSPKAGVAFYLQPFVTHYKYIMRAGQVDPLDGLPTHALDSLARPERPPVTFNGEVYLQPCDEGDAEKNAANVRACVESCLKHGYILGAQNHKTWGLP